MNIEINENPLLVLKDKITNPYYLEFLHGKLVAVIEGLPEDDPECQKYYQSCNGVSAVFLLVNHPEYNPKPRLRSEYFVFDEEYDGCIHEDSIIRAESIAYVTNNPYILYFKGSDDGSVGLRFPSEEAAMNYLNSLVYFEQVFENPYLYYDN